MKKTLFKIICITSLLFSLLAMSVSCGGYDGGAREECEMGDMSEKGAIAYSIEEPDAESGENQDDGDAEETREIYELILTHVSGIISVITLVISVILTSFHKKKLMPTIGGALGNIGDSVRTISEKAEITLATAEEAARRVGLRIEDIDGVIESFGAALTEMEKRMCELEAHKTNGESIKIMMRTEVEELSKIFSASDMSEVAKRTVEEKLTVIKSHLES